MGSKYCIHVILKCLPLHPCEIISLGEWRKAFISFFDILYRLYTQHSKRLLISSYNDGEKKENGSHSLCYRLFKSYIQNIYVQEAISALNKKNIFLSTIQRAFLNSINVPQHHSKYEQHFSKNVQVINKDHFSLIKFKGDVCQKEIKNMSLLPLICWAPCDVLKFNLQAIHLDDDFYPLIWVNAAITAILFCITE